MANVHKVLIEGRMPYDIVNRLAKQSLYGLTMFAMLSSPSWGLEISYGKTSMKPVSETGGHRTYYEFRIAGEEAIWQNGIVKFCKDLIAAGVEITRAECMDMEFDYMPTGGSIMKELQ